MYVPKEIFLTKGVGKHKEKLASFEMALRNAKIAAFNIVEVSSIFPPRCKMIYPSIIASAKKNPGRGIMPKIWLPPCWLQCWAWISIPNRVGMPEKNFGK
jgi:hypothetical protein